MSFKKIEVDSKVLIVRTLKNGEQVINLQVLKAKSLKIVGALVFGDMLNFNSKWKTEVKLGRIKS